jgi:D-aminopeptidase
MAKTSPFVPVALVVEDDVMQREIAPCDPNVRFGPLADPRKRTCAVQLGMSALCQKRTSVLFDHLVGAGE